MSRRVKAAADPNNGVRFDIRDVARLAGVSVATVSRTVNNVPTVNTAMAARVRDAIRELNYFPNTQARALVSGRSRLIGLLVPDITNPFFPELIKRFEETAVKRNYELLIGSTNYDSEIQHCLRRLIERNVDGVAIMTFGVEDPVLGDLSTRHIPMVFVDVSQEAFPQDAVMIDYRHGMEEAVRHLVALGHTEIGFISGPLNQHSATLRRIAFHESMAAAGCIPKEKFIVEGDHQLEGGMAGMTKLLDNPKPPSAVLCSNDLMAIGALRTLQTSGLRVPEDMSIVGFDDIHLAEFVNPPLTTVRMSQVELAREAIQVLIARIEKLNPADHPASQPVSTRLVIRGTTAPPRPRPRRK
ncbi:LacI family DNA-binding transcriptional regulator [Granulicella arctica]|uniref:LacI family transcriptional regulator n=1 Tax=Granulicella arctica TaxID=940613 RepID=A0A7Y9PEY7_9BACT|nr:LacI family DNA-binding transcriptional regulator [Granulicella arctica]NYF78683.1 LacI family transcriptional regulator [Granulicella arctica]